MNKFLILFFLFFNFHAYAQLTITTKYIEIYIWDEEEGEWGDIVVENENYAFLEFNEEFTFMKITSSGNKTSYSLSNSKHHDEYDHYTYDAMSDEGYESTLIVDLKSDTPNVRFIMDLEESTILVRHIAKYWFEDEE